MPLDRDKARRFLREEFDLDVADDDLLLATYAMASLALEHLKPEIEHAFTVSAQVTADFAKTELATTHEQLRSLANAMAGLKDGMMAALEAANTLKTLNNEATANVVAMNQAADRLEKAAMAAAAGNRRR